VRVASGAREYPQPRMASQGRFCKSKDQGKSVSAAGVLHDELASPHESEAGAYFVAKLALGEADNRTAETGKEGPP
jgi:hypothetical protein